MILAKALAIPRPSTAVVTRDKNLSAQTDYQVRARCAHTSRSSVSSACTPCSECSVPGPPLIAHFQVQARKGVECQEWLGVNKSQEGVGDGWGWCSGQNETPAGQNHDETHLGNLYEK